MGETLAAGDAAVEAVGLTLGLDMADWWQPDAAFFDLLRDKEVLGVLPVHGIVRGRIGKFGRGQVSSVPEWLWGLLLLSIVAIVVLVFRGPMLFAPRG